jgi:diguanylate cyclase
VGGRRLTTKIPALSAEARRSTLISAAAITLASVTASELVTLLAGAVFHLNPDVPAFLMAGIIPLLIAAPASYWQLKRLEQVRAAYRELERVASTDWLTGCLNRRAFSAAAALATAVGRPSALLIVDVDGLKSVNDRFGHDRGDSAVRSVAAVIAEQLDSSDLFGRIDGEEFAVYLRVAAESHAADVAEAIRKGVEAIGLGTPETARLLSVSVGIATVDAPIAFSDLFRIADRQLGAAKASGRNRVAITAAADVSQAAA